MNGIRLKPFLNFFLNKKTTLAMALGTGWKDTALLYWRYDAKQIEFVIDDENENTMGNTDSIFISISLLLSFIYLWYYAEAAIFQKRHVIDFQKYYQKNYICVSKLVKYCIFASTLSKIHRKNYVTFFITLMWILEATKNELSHFCLRYIFLVILIYHKSVGWDKAMHNQANLVKNFIALSKLWSEFHFSLSEWSVVSFPLIPVNSISICSVGTVVV